MLKNSIKISEYPFVPVNGGDWLGRIEGEAYVLGYAKQNYGAKFIQKNYLIPLSSIRTDLLRYAGVQNVKPSYTNLVLLWVGTWSDAKSKSIYGELSLRYKANSYIYEWKDTENAEVLYIHNKHLKLDDFENSRVFIVDKAPYPAEQASYLFGEEVHGVDPNINTLKIVDKAYVDGRFDGWRVISNITDDTFTFVDNNLNIRSYTCFYLVDRTLNIGIDGLYTLNFVTTPSNPQDQRGNIQETIKKNNKRVTFFVRLRNCDEYWKSTGDLSGHICKLRFTVDGNPVEWTYEDEINEIMRLETSKTHFNFKFQLYYENELVKVLGGAMFGRDSRGGVLQQLNFDEDESSPTSTRNIPLLKYRDRIFISQYYDYEQVKSKEDEGAVQTISFNTDGLENELELSWKYYLITPYWNVPEGEAYDRPTSWKQNIEHNIRFGDNILWTSNEICDFHPQFQPNRLYCLEFTRVLDGFLIGRVLWNVSLVKKNALT